MLWKTKINKPKHIGCYDLLDQFTESGLGTIYKARHQEGGEIVAVKIIYSDFAKDPVLCRRMEQESQVSRRLEHPHLVKGIDFGMENGQPFIVTEFVEGESLRERIKREGSLPEEEAVTIIRQIASAAQLIHERNYVHRDIQPDNILLTSDGGAKLSDLGLVKCLDVDVELTQGCGILGTPNYAAPEQFDNAANADARADVYALGACLYSALTGDIPFWVAREKNYLAILKKKLLNELIPPRKKVPSISRCVDLAVRRALRADPAERFTTCGEFVKAIDGDLRGSQQMESAKGEGASNPYRGGSRRERKQRTDQRTAVRYLAPRRTTCGPYALLKEISTLAKIHDISSTGVGLQLPRRFEPGTLLILEIGEMKDHFLCGHLVEVVRVLKRDGLAWYVGCRFIHKLSSAQVKTISVI